MPVLRELNYYRIGEYMSRWKQFNPNPLNQRVGDCTIRAICKALNSDWETVFAGVMVKACQLSDMPSANEAAKFGLQQTLDRKSYLLSRQNKAYNDFCEQNGLRKQSERLQIARWQREQAAKARGAARRYQNAKGG